MPGKKFYVVWEGRTPGIYDNWSDAKAQVDQFTGAKYKSFDSILDAQKYFREGYKAYYQEHPIIPTEKPTFASSTDLKPVLDSICVDAACNMVTRVMEYRGVDTRTGQVIFHRGPFNGGTNNMGEFLALVHGLALLKQQGSNIPIYTDSITAISWVRHKKHKSIVLPTEENALLFDLLNRAENWLKNNTFQNPIVKWNTKAWGEIPADFGRK